MNINKIISDKIYPTLRKLGFQVREVYDSLGFGCRLQFQLNTLIFSVTFDRREQVFSVAVATGGDFFPLTDKVLSQLYGITSNIGHYSKPKEFAEQLLPVLQEEKIQKMLLGDVSQLKDFYYQQSLTYTDQTGFEHQLRILADVWSNKDYKKFIALIDALKIDKEQLPETYQLKYKIAQKYQK